MTIYLAPRLAPGPPRLLGMTGGTALPPWSSSQPGDEPGAHSPSIRPCSRWGLAAAASPQSAGRSYRPISPLPRCEILRCAQNDIRAGAVCFCATFRLPLRANPSRKPGRYPAPCPVEPGLSSPDQPGRPPGPRHLHRQSSIGAGKGQLDCPVRADLTRLRSSPERILPGPDLRIPCPVCPEFPRAGRAGKCILAFAEGR